MHYAHLPYCGMIDVTITPKKDIEITAASVMEAPDALKDVQNYYNEIDRPHVTISLLSSTAKSPTVNYCLLHPPVFYLMNSMAVNHVSFMKCGTTICT